MLSRSRETLSDRERQRNPAGSFPMIFPCFRKDKIRRNAHKSYYERTFKGNWEKHRSPILIIISSLGLCGRDPIEKYIMPLQNTVDFERFNIHVPEIATMRVTWWQRQSAIPTVEKADIPEMTAYSTLNERSANFEGRKLRLARRYKFTPFYGNKYTHGMRYMLSEFVHSLRSLREGGCGGKRSKCAYR